MIFRFLLFGFAVMMRGGFWVTRLKDKKFRKQLRSGDFVMQIAIRKNRKGRYYMLKDGRFISKTGFAPREADFLIEWSDAYTPLRTLFKFSPSALIKSLSKSISDGNLVVEMELANTTWFGLTMLQMLNAYVNLGLFNGSAE